MKAVALIAMALLLAGCKGECRWSPEPVREDLRTCNAARAGNYAGGIRFWECMKSMGYTEVCVDR